MTDKEILQRALAKYGLSRRMRKCQEECAELIAAINHYQENPDSETLARLCEELADVDIMLMQMLLFFNDHGRVKENTIRKLARLAEAVQ